MAESNYMIEYLQLFQLSMNPYLKIKNNMIYIILINVIFLLQTKIQVLLFNHKFNYKFYFYLFDL